MESTAMIDKHAGTVSIWSSNGEWVYRKMTDQIVYNPPYPQDDAHGNTVIIQRFDWEEYKKYYSITKLPPNVDILVVGYWYSKRWNSPESEWEYEEPCNEYREELKLGNSLIVET